MPWAVGLIYRKPLFIAATGEPVGLQLCPGLAAVGRAVHVLTKCLKKAQVEESSCLIRAGYRVAAEHSGFQNTGERPVDAAIGGITPAALSEVRCNAVKLPPTNCHLVAVCGINRDRALVRSVANDVHPVRVDVCLIADEDPIRGDHSRRSLQTVNIGRRVVVFFQWLPGVRVPRRRLAESTANCHEEDQTDQQARSPDFETAHVTSY